MGNEAPGVNANEFFNAHNIPKPANNRQAFINDMVARRWIKPRKIPDEEKALVLEPVRKKKPDADYWEWDDTIVKQLRYRRWNDEHIELLLLDTYGNEGMRQIILATETHAYWESKWHCHACIEFLLK